MKKTRHFTETGPIKGILKEALDNTVDSDKSFPRNEEEQALKNRHFNYNMKQATW